MRNLIIAAIVALIASPAFAVMSAADCQTAVDACKASHSDTMSDAYKKCVKDAQDKPGCAKTEPSK